VIAAIVMLAGAQNIAMRAVETTKFRVPLRTFFCETAEGSGDFYIVEFEYWEGKNLFNVDLTKNAKTDPAIAFQSTIEQMGDAPNDGGVIFALRPKGHDAEMRVTLDPQGRAKAQLKLNSGAIDRPCSQVPNMRNEDS